MSEQAEVKTPILYLGASAEKKLPAEILDRCELTRCDCCRVPVRVVSETLAQTRALSLRTGRRLDVLCRGCFDREGAKAESLIVAHVASRQ